jgi:hypothetical protein
MTGAAAPLGMLVNAWPKLSETFILEEVLGLERQGVPLRLYALAEPTDAIAHGAVSRVRSPLARVPAARPTGALWSDHAAVAAAAPWCYARALALALRRGRTGWQDFLRAGALAARLRRDGVAHLHAHFISRPADIAQLCSRRAWPACRSRSRRTPRTSTCRGPPICGAASVQRASPSPAPTPTAAPWPRWRRAPTWA